MADHALEFVARQELDAAPRHSHSRIRRAVACGKGIDRLLLEHIHLRHRNARGQRHFFHHIQKAAFTSIRGRGIHWNAPEHLGDGFSSLRKLRNFHQAPDDHRNQDARRCEAQHLPIIERLTQNQAESDVQKSDDAYNGQNKIKNQPLRLKPSPFLLFKKIHRLGSGARLCRA